jgi:hypothetical protein
VGVNSPAPLTTYNDIILFRRNKMEYTNNPTSEEEVVETPVLEETPVVEETPIVEEAPVVETPAEPEVEAPAPVVEEPVSAITTPTYDSHVEEVPALGPVGDGAIGATTTVRQPRSAKKKAEVSVSEKVAVYSTKNVTWSEVGKVYRGYNIVSKDASEKWLTRSHIRLATPEEVAKEFGK